MDHHLVNVRISNYLNYSFCKRKDLKIHSFNEFFQPQDLNLDYSEYFKAIPLFTTGNEDNLFVMGIVYYIPFPMNPLYWLLFYRYDSSWNIEEVSLYRHSVLSCGIVAIGRYRKDNVFRINMVFMCYGVLFEIIGIVKDSSISISNEREIISTVCSFRILPCELVSNSITNSKPLQEFEFCNKTFMLPDSWEIDNRNDDNRTIDISLFSSTEILCAITLSVHEESDSVAAILYSIMSQLDDSGFEVENEKGLLAINKKENIKLNNSLSMFYLEKNERIVDPMKKLENGWIATGVINGVLNGRKVELRISLFEDYENGNSSLFSLYMLSIPRIDDFQLWTRCLSTFEIIKLMGNKSLIEDLFYSSCSTSAEDEFLQGVVSESLLDGNLPGSGFRAILKNAECIFEDERESESDIDEIDSDTEIESTMSTKSSDSDTNSMTTRKPVKSKLPIPVIRKRKVSWVPDEQVISCIACSQAFTVLRRRHHCRSCGFVFCNSCTSKTISLNKKNNPVRVCDNCYDLVKLKNNSVSLPTVSSVYHHHPWVSFNIGCWARYKIIKTVGISSKTIELVKKLTDINEENETYELKSDNESRVLPLYPLTEYAIEFDKQGIEELQVENTTLLCTVWRKRVNVDNKNDLIHERTVWIEEDLGNSEPVQVIEKWIKVDSFGNKTVKRAKKERIISLSIPIWIQSEKYICHHIFGEQIDNNPTSKNNTRVEKYTCTSIPGFIVKQKIVSNNKETETILLNFNK